MQKTVLIIILMLLTLNVRAANDSVVNTRESLGTLFNDTVFFLKKSFLARDKELTFQNESSKDLKRIAEELRDNSKVAESNPKVLKHGRKKIPECDYTIQDLEWENSKGWVCSDASYPSDCVAEKGYERVKVSENQYVCNYIGKYRVEKAGWGACNIDKGEKYEQWKCLRSNEDSKDKEYEVEKSYCANLEKPKLLKKACGPKGGDSKCSCPNGQKYAYISGKGFCLEDLKFRHYGHYRAWVDGAHAVIGANRSTFHPNHNDPYSSYYKVYMWMKLPEDYQDSAYTEFYNNNNAVKGIYKHGEFSCDDDGWWYLNGVLHEKQGKKRYRYYNWASISNNLKSGKNLIKTELYQHGGGWLLGGYIITLNNSAFHSTPECLIK